MALRSIQKFTAYTYSIDQVNQRIRQLVYMFLKHYFWGFFFWYLKLKKKDGEYSTALISNVNRMMIIDF